MADDWWTRRECQTYTAELFYPETGGDAPKQVQQAKAICMRCEVRQECLDDAMARFEPYGIWGGLTPQERSRKRRKPRTTRRGRPPKQKPVEAA